MLGIEAIGSYIPPGRVCNFGRKECFGIDDTFITDKIGFKAVARKAPGEDTSDLCVKVFNDLQARCGLRTEVLPVYERPGLLESADHAQRGILEAAKALGMDLGAEWGNELDLRQKE